MATFRPTRRSVLAGMTASLAAPAVLRAQAAFAQGGPIKLGSLTPLTGVGGNYGPFMRDAIAGVIGAVNEAGGVLGREIVLVSEDTQTSPEAAVRAARKLIDVDGVAAIMGTWASSVTTAVAPLCWENQTMLFCVSGADSITLLPHRGFIARTQPNSKLQNDVATAFMVDQGATHLGWIGPQTPFAQGNIDNMTRIAGENGMEMDSLIYEADKSTYRSEVDTIMRAGPDFILLGGYTADTTVLLRDLWQAGYEGKLIGPAYAVNQTVLDALPADVLEGIFTWEPAPAIGSPAYANVQKILGVETVDPYSAQCYDHANLAILSIAAGGEATGATIRDSLRTISQGEGTVVSSAVEGLPIIADGVNYDGASGPCDFNEIGDITGTQFLFKRIEDGAAVEFART
ncbi:ABC transporter substrate-binding protein [Acuticoccus sediminis]|uniref:ABC transporter substrate-binding protein n=1 Tax=Acuticoccus sediminis TaxID=2184697 RepID=A0A8B2P264_9HYPH|nr:ABC transporter substrate-binding protein [Acuticoccus sediminis]RAI03212.1 ABC transporter substrate-binding protein [Acuticoccus sediminis]